MSREAVRWTPATREFLKKQFAEAQVEATSLVEKELQEKDFLKWLAACKNITSYSGRKDSAIGRLSRIVDLKTLKPRFKCKETSLKIQFEEVSSVFEGFTIKIFTKYLDKKENKFQVSREDINNWQSFKLEALYLKENTTSRTKDIYICDQNSGSFVVITPKTDEEISGNISSLIVSNKLERKHADTVLEKRISKRNAILELLSESEWYKNYDELVVPEDYLKSLNKIEEDFTKTEEDAKQLTPAEIRKLEERLVVNTLRPRWSSFNEEGVSSYQNVKLEPKIVDIENSEGKLYYAFQEDLSKLHLAAHILDRHFSKHQGGEFYGDKYKLVSISKSVKKHFTNHSHINNFFGKSELVKEGDTIKGINIMFDNAITVWNTARQIEPHLKDLVFLENFSNFNEEMATLYQELKSYVSENYVRLTDYHKRFGMKEHYEDFISFLDKITELQVYCEEETDVEKIAEKVSEIILPGNKTLPKGTIGGIAVDRTMIKKLEKLIEYTSPAKDLLNNIPLLTTSSNVDISPETSMLLREYLEFKKLL